MKYQIIRTWEIESNNIIEAILKTKNWNHKSISAEKIGDKNG